MRASPAMLAFLTLACTTPVATDAGSDAAAWPDVGADSQVACAALTADQAGESGVAAWIGASPPAHDSYDAAHYDTIFTGTGERDDFVPLGVDVVDATHLRLRALVTADYASCDTPNGPIVECSTFPAAAIATYVIRLDETLPLATLLRAQPLALDDARTQLHAVPGQLDAYPSCTAAGVWDVWAVPAAVRAGPGGAECYSYLPPAFDAVLLRDRYSGRSWDLALPVLPSACTETWAGTGTGADCVPAMGLATGTTGPRTMTFIGTSPVPPMTGQSPYSCALQAMCLGSCVGCWSSPYTEGVCVADLDATWMRSVCAAEDIDAIPIPTTTFECRRSCASIHCPTATL